MDALTPDADKGAEGEPEAPRGTSPTPWQRHWLAPVAIAVLLIGGFFGVRWLSYSRTHVGTDDAQVESDIYPISARVSGHIAAVFVETNQQVKAGQLLAQVDPKDYTVAVQQAEAVLGQAESAAQAAHGTVRVTQRTGGAGISQAEAGVAASRAEELASQRAAEAAVGQVEAARAAEHAAEAAVEMAERDVASARAVAESERAKAEEAEREATRSQHLLARGAVSGEQSEQASTAASAARANVRAAEARLSTAEAAVTQARARRRQSAAAVTQAAQNAAAAQAATGQAHAAIGQAEAQVTSAQASPAQVGVRRAEAQGAKASVAAARARLEQARLNLAYTRIIAPIDGTVAQKNLKLGQYVQTGQSLIALTPLQPRYVVANYKETQLVKMKVGQAATFTVDAYPGVTFSGRVASLSPGTGAIFSLLPPENATGNFTKVVQRVPVRIRIDEDSLRRRPLRQGMSVIAAVDTGSK